jgi:glycosyltransferase involved in cell wall biosynthesis
VTRVALHDFGGFPFSIQLGRTLAARGHEVAYLHPVGFRSPRGNVSRQLDGDPRFTFEPLDLHEPSQQHGLVNRYLQDRRYGDLLAERIGAIRPEVVISANAPIPAQQDAVDAAHRAGAGFVFWVQDLVSVAVRQILGRRVPLAGRAVGSWIMRAEKRVLLSSDAVVAISPDFVPTLREWGIPSERVSVIENWAPLDEIQPMSRINAWAVDNRLPTGARFLYAGTLGRKHDPSILVSLAESIPEAAVVVVTEGPRAQQLREQAAGHPNLLVLPTQPADRISEVLGSSDVLVALLEADAGSFSVPSKVQSYLAAGRAILASIPGDNPATQAIVRAGAGRVVEPGDRAGFLAAARDLIADPEARAEAGRAARRYATQQFDIQLIADEFERVIAGCAPVSPESARGTMSRTST